MKKILLIAILACSYPAFAQAPDGPGDNPDAVPVDGGLSLLVVAGAGYGVKKLKERRALKQQDAK